MSKLLREFRLIPIVLAAVVCLLVLKSMGILLDGGYTLGPRFAGSDTLIVTKGPATPAAASIRASDPDVTGSAGPTPAPPKDAKAERGSVPAPYDPNAKGTRIPLDTPPRPASAAERALLERLQERRQELDARARELDVRESLLAAAEKKLEGKAEQKASDGKGGGARKDDPDARFKAIVTMYETMKPKEAAKIFDRLDIRVLLEVASQINPRVMSAILAQMTPEVAERLTVELAARGSSSEKSINPNDLPKIEGKPTN
jgi:flagellar motility protein MotE (MotC chaperone)